MILKFYRTGENDMKNVKTEMNTPQMMETLGLFGKMLNIASIYGTRHPSLKAPLEETHQALDTTLKAEGKVILGLFNKTLTINDKMVSDYTVHLRALERKFISLNIPHLVLRKGMTQSELAQLAELLCSSANRSEQSLKDSLDEANLKHIRAEQVDYVAQHEGERLVGENEGLGKGEEGDDVSDGDDHEEGDKKEEEGDQEDKGEPPPSIQIEQIMAFLKGDVSAEDAPTKDMQDLLSDPEKLGQLIMESVSVRQSAQSLDNSESLADIVIGCLRRTYEGLNEQKKYKSARGKASLHKAMLLLEKTVVDKIRNSVGEEQPDVDEQILEALRDAEEQRQVEILAARYAEQHKKITKAELDILKYVREHGEEKARVMLQDSDVPEEEWNRLMVQARQTQAAEEATPGGNGEEGATGGQGSGSGDNMDMGALAIVLDKLETIMDLDNIPPEIVKSAVDEVRENIDDTTAQAERQIDKIEEKIVQHEEDCKYAPNSEKQRKQRADILLEISQLALKLSQPLTVITASIDAVRLQSCTPDIQKEMLELAYQSGETMKELMKRLTKLVGYPSMQDADMNLQRYS